MKLVRRLRRSQPAWQCCFGHKHGRVMFLRGRTRQSPSGAENKVNLVAAGIGCMHQLMSHEVRESQGRVEGRREVKLPFSGILADSCS